MSRGIRRLAGGAADAVLDAFWLGVRIAALPLTPLRIGRLFRTVSVPRLREHRLRTSLTVVGIALGVAVLVAVATVNQSILKSVASTIDDVAGKADLQITAGGSGFDEGLVEKVRAAEGVYKAAVIVEQTVTLRDPKVKGERLLLLGVDFLNADDDYFRTYGSAELEAIERDSFTFLNSPYNLLIGKSVAEKLGRALHDRVVLQTPQGKHDFEIWGFLGSEGVGRAFGGAVAVMDYGAMQLAFDRGKNIDRIDVAVRPGADVSATARALRSALGPGFSVDRPERRNERVSYMLASLSNGLTLASIVALLVGMFLIYNTVAIGVVQRRREIGTLRALGATRRDVLSLFVLEGFLFGLVGAALGVAGGLGLARVLLGGMARTVTEMFFAVPASRVHADHGTLVAMAVLGVTACTLAASIPALQAARTSPIETLRTGAVVRVPPLSARPRPSDGLALASLLAAWLLLRVPPVHGLPIGAAAACFGLALGAAFLAPRLLQLTHVVLSRALMRASSPEARLATENLPRNVVRTSATVSALMVGVAMATSFATFIGSFESSTLDWVDQCLPADLFVTSAARMAGGGAGVPMNSELGESFASLPGVRGVERVRMVDLDYKGYPIKLVATELADGTARTRLVMLEGTEAEAIRRLRAGAIVVAENFSRKFGVHEGDRITLGVKNETHDFDVAGVIVDYTSDTGVLRVDRDTYVRHWGDERVDTFDLYLQPGSDPERTRRAINADLSERYDLFVLTNREFRDAILAMLDEAFAVMHLLEAVAIVISVLGVVNALLASVLDRIRELGILRAVGMLRRQVIAMVVLEGWLIGVMGVAGGICLGLSIGNVMLEYVNLAQTGWYLPFRPSWGAVAETSALVAVGSALAGLYPARYAARLPVSAALAYE